MYKKPVVAILRTGNEIVDIQNPMPHLPSLDIIPNSTENRVDAHVDAITQGLQSAAMLLTTGGISMGSIDLCIDRIDGCVASLSRAKCIYGFTTEDSQIT